MIQWVKRLDNSDQILYFNYGKTQCPLLYACPPYKYFGRRALSVI